MDGSEELLKRQAECGCDPTQSVNPDIPLPAFDAAHVISMEPRAFGKLLLRNPMREPQLSNAASDRLGQVHRSMLRSCTL